MEIPVKDTKEEEASETTEETPETTEEPVEEPKEEPAMAMEENSSMREEESSMLEEEPQTEEYTIRESNFEKYIGENLFGKIGILIFIIGIGFFVKYAIDQNWINETARTLMGYAVGVGMLVLAERLHKRYHAFSSLLAGGAFGIFYLITAIAFHYYALFSHTTAFVILCATTLFMSAVSILYDRVELAVTALVGGFIAPFIISTNASSIISLQIYISILNVGMFCLTMYKRWAILPIISFCFTYCILWGTQAMTYISSSETGTIYPTLFALLHYSISSSCYPWFISCVHSVKERQGQDCYLSLRLTASSICSMAIISYNNMNLPTMLRLTWLSSLQQSTLLSICTYASA